MTRHRLKSALTRVLATTLTVLLAIVGLPVAAHADDSLGALPKGFESYATGALESALERDPALLVPGTQYGIALQWTASEMQEFPAYLDFGIDMGASDFEFAGDITAIPSGMKAVEKIEDLGSGMVRVYFYSDAKERMGSQPIEQLEFKFQTELAGEGVEKSKIAWSGSAGASEILLVPSGAQKITGTNNVNKSSGATDFSGYTAGRTGLVFDDAKLDASVKYTVTASSTTAGDVTVTDVLHAEWLEYPAVSDFTVTLDTWVDLGEGYGKRETKTLSSADVVIAADGRSFKYVGELPANSTIKIEYTAKLTTDSTKREYFKTTFKDLYANAPEGAYLGLSGQNAISVVVGGKAPQTTTNTATIGINKYLPPRPNINGDTLSKAVDKADLGFRDFSVVNDDRVLAVSETLKYTLKADLAAFNPAKAPVVDGSQDTRFFTLTKDVILTDTLATGATWDATNGRLNNLTATRNGASYTLTFAGTGEPTNVGEYTLNGRTLKINVGKNHADSWVINAQVIFDAAGMTPSIDGATKYETYNYTNRVEMKYSTEGQSNGSTGYNATTKVTDRNDDGARDVVDTSVFNKVAKEEVVDAKPEEAATVEYDITVVAGSKNDDVIDLSATDVVDHVDTSVFDLGAYDAYAKSYENVTLKAVLIADGKSTTFTGSDYELEWDAANNGVRITPSTATAAIIKNTPTGGKSSKIVFTLTLKTFPIEGLQIIKLSNSASYLGDSAIEGNYTTSVKSSGSSMGAFLNLAKSAYDAKNDRFSTGVRIQPSSINTADDTASVVFRLSMLVPEKFTAKIDLKDDLNKAGLVFEGFLDDQNDTTPSTSAVTLGRGIEVKQAGGIVNITTNGKTTAAPSSAGQTVFEVFYSVKIEEWSTKQDLPIINVAGTSSTTVTVTDKFPLNVTKVDSKDATKAISDESARFSVLDSDGKVVAKDIFIKDNKLVVKAADGSTKALLVDEPGTYTIREDRAPANYYKTATTVEATVDANGVTREVLFYNDPMVPGSVSIAKAVQGSFSDLLSTKQFTFTWTATAPTGKLLEDDQKSGTVQVRYGQTVTLDKTFPPGTQVTFAEDLTSVELVDHIFNGLTLDKTTVTVESGNTVKVTATNIYTGKVSVGNYVWVDSNRDGIQDAGETPIEGVKLILRDSDGNEVTDVNGNRVLPTTTNAQGEYYFSDLPVLSGNKTYVVSIDQTDSNTQTVLSPYVPTLAGQGDRAKDSSTWTAATQTGDLTKGGQFDHTLDFGFVLPSYAVGDVAWIDTDRNGLQDAGEKPLAGVTVTLLDKSGNPVTDILGNAVAAQTTDANGRYLFDNLAAGEYKVQFELTAEQSKKYVFTKNVSGTDSEDNSDAVVDANPAIATTATFVLDDSNTALDASYTDQTFIATQGVDPTWDAGVHLKYVSVGDYVWFDSNRDGVQGDPALEPGIEGVRLELVDLDGNPVVDVYGEPVGPTFTDKDGKYSFENLPALLDDDQIYTVKIITDPTITNADGDTVTNPIADLLPTREGGIPGEPTDRATDSSTNKASTVPGTLKEHLSEDPTLDFGFMARTFAIGDYTWIDTNRNGLQDAGEQPLAGVTATLLDKHGNAATDILGSLVDPVQTDQYGRYLFDNLAEGEYQVQFTLTPEQAQIYDFTSNEAGTDSTDNSDGVVAKDPARALTVVVTLNSANTHLTKNYIDGAGNKAALKATEGIDPTWDAGVYLKKVSVGDYVWVDTDRDGVQGDPATEPGIPGVQLEITVTDENGDPILDPQGKPIVVTDVWGDIVDPQVTDSDGQYLFEDLPALPTGQFYVVTINRDDPGTKKALEPYVPTTPGATDSDKDSSTWSEKASWDGLQTDGAHNPTLDFGFVVPSFAVGDVVWIDLNRDGLQGADEAPLEGVTVTLLDKDGQPVKDVLGNDVAPVKTDANGRYLFDNLAAGEYKVQFQLTEKQAQRYVFTKNVAGTESRDNSDAMVTDNAAIAESKAFTLDRSNTALSTEYADQAFIATQGVDPTWDAGVHLKRVSVGDYVWFDADKDGVQDDSEKGIPGVKLYLTDKDGNPVVDVFGNPVGPVVTDKNGKYTFENLPALVGGEQYVVRIDQDDAGTAAALERYVPTVEGSGDVAFDSSTWVAIATSEGLTQDGDRNPTLDFGFVINPDLEELGQTEDPGTPGSDTDVNTDGKKPDLPSTGFGGLPLAIAAAMLVALGGVLFGVRRRAS